MKFNNIDETRKILEEFYKIQGIDEKIRQMQYCVLANDLKPEMLARHLEDDIKRLCKSNKHRLSSALFRNLLPISRNLVRCLTTKRGEFIQYISFIVEAFLINVAHFHDQSIIDENIMQISKNSFEILLKRQMIENLGKLKIRIKNPEFHLQTIQYIDFYSGKTVSKYAKNRHNPKVNNWLKTAFILLFLGLLSLMYFKYNIPVFLMLNALPLTAALTIFYQSEQDAIVENLFSEFDELKVSRNYILQDVKIFEFEEKSSMPDLKHEFFIAPQWVKKEEQFSNETKEPIKEVKENFHTKRRYPKLWNLTLTNLLYENHVKPLSEIIWKTDSVLLHKPGNRISKDDVYPLTNKLFKTRYYGFFNKELLKKLNPQTALKYLDILRKGIIVGPKGESGIKQLRSSIFFHRKIFINTEFQWAIKILSEKERLIGSECARQIVDGSQHVLIDFCCNYKMH